MTRATLYALHVAAHTGYVWSCPHCRAAWLVIVSAEMQNERTEQ